MSVILNPYRYASGGGDQGFNPETDVSSATLINWLEPDSFDSANNLWETKSSTGTDWTVSGGVSLVTGGAEYNNENVVEFSQGQIDPTISDGFHGLTAAECFLLIDIDEDPPSEETKTGLWMFGSNVNPYNFYPTTGGVISDQFACESVKTVGDPSASLTDPRIVNIWSAPSDWQYNLDNSSLYNTSNNAVRQDINPQIGVSFYINASPFYVQVNYLYGRIRAFLFYNGKLSSDDRDAVYNYVDAMRA